MKDILLTVLIALISSGTITTIITTIFKAWWEKHTKDDPQRIAVRMLLQRQIETECINCLERGEIKYSMLKRIRAEHHCYHDGLKGNGDLDELMADVEKLPVIFDIKEN